MANDLDASLPLTPHIAAEATRELSWLRGMALSLRLLIRMKGSGGLRLRWRTLRNTLKPSTPGNSQSTIARS